MPLAESDYIIPSLGEELGLIGVFAILALYLLFISRGFRIGFAGQDDFGGCSESASRSCSRCRSSSSSAA